MGNRQRWFNDLCEANYAKHISPGGKILEVGCGKAISLSGCEIKAILTLKEWTCHPKM